jgi:hypothetical protein
MVKYQLEECCDLVRADRATRPSGTVLVHGARYKGVADVSFVFSGVITEVIKEVGKPETAFRISKCHDQDFLHRECTPVCAE